MNKSFKVKEYALKYNRHENHNLAEICCHLHEVEELTKKLDSECNLSDMKAWNISAEEWRDAITAAINELIDNAIQNKKMSGEL